MNRLAAVALLAVVAFAEETREIRLVARNVPAPPRATLTVSGGTDVEFREPGWWSSREPLTPSLTTLAVWRTGTIRGRIALAQRDAKLPKSIDLVVEAPPLPAKQPEIARGTRFVCPVGDDGTWTCDVPATTLDLVIRSGSFVPVYRWAVEIEPGGKRDLGAIPLRTGSSILAWLDPEAAKALAAPARARLLRMVAPGTASETAARLSVPVAESAFNSRGAVQLTAVPEGSYLLEVTAKGFAPARVFPIDVYPARETVLRRAITLAPPVTLRVDIVPPLDPVAKPWQLSLLRLADFSSGVDSSVSPRLQANEMGQVRAAEHAPGRYLATVRDAAGNSWWATEWRIEDEASATHRVEIPLVRVRGTISDGASPLPATLWFGGRHGAVRMKLTSDGEGRFEGVLPRQGKWRLEVESAALPAATQLDVDVDDDDLAIELPATRLSGWVIDSAGERVAGASLTMLIEPSPITTRTDAHGKFSFRAFPSAPFVLLARHGTEMARTAEFTVQPSARDGVEIRLEPTRSIRGRLVSRRGPVIGAGIRARAIPAAGGTARAVSDGDGRFELRLPATSTRASFVIATPGHALQAFELAVGEEPVQLEVAVEGGTLLLDVPPRGVHLTQNGAAISLAELMDWADALGSTARDPLRIPNVAPGAIRACVPGGPCAEGQLAAGGTLELDLRP